MPSTGPHILQTFNEALDGLHNKLLMMSSMAERNLHSAMLGLMNRDDDLCSVVIADDDEIDAMEKEIDFEGVDLLRRFQPVATDLRLVIATIKLNGNIERIADQAANIAKRARKLNRVPPLDEIHLLEPMFHEATLMFRDSLRAYIEHDAELARSVKAHDKKLDALHHEVGDRITEVMAAKPDRISDYVNLLFIGRYLERTGDHVKNIAEEVVYAISAEDIRHGSITPAQPPS